MGGFLHFLGSLYGNFIEIICCKALGNYYASIRTNIFRFYDWRDQKIMIYGFVGPAKPLFLDLNYQMTVENIENMGICSILIL